MLSSFPVAQGVEVHVSFFVDTNFRPLFLFRCGSCRVRSSGEVKVKAAARLCWLWHDMSDSRVTLGKAMARFLVVRGCAQSGQQNNNQSRGVWLRVLSLARHPHVFHNPFILSSSRAERKGVLWFKNRTDPDIIRARLSGNEPGQPVLKVSLFSSTFAPCPGSRRRSDFHASLHGGGQDRHR